MKKIVGLCSLATINCSALYLIYWYIFVSASIKAGNIFHIPYEPSGMQLSFYFLSAPLFILLMCLSSLHSHYFDLKRSLSLGLMIIWLSYFALLLYVDCVIHFSSKSHLLYHGSLIISLAAIMFVIYATYYQVMQLMHKTRQES